MDINNILTQIETYKTKTAEKAEQERIAAERYRKDLFDQIRAMKPDIDNLIKVAKSAQEAGISLAVGWMVDKTYDNGDFFTDATTHKIGFARAPHANKEIIGVGFEGSGCCGNYDFFTDGLMIYDKDRDDGRKTREASTEHLEKFIEKFPEFEKAFYAHIEKVTNCEVPVKPKYYINIQDYNDEQVAESKWFDSEAEAINWWKELGYLRSGDYIASLLRINHPTNNENDYDVEFVKYL